MRCLIIGYGSIGKRHAEVLKELGCEVFLQTAQKIPAFPCFSELKEALEQQIDYVIIANETSEHYETLRNLIESDFRGVVLVEKPLYAQFEPVLPENNIAQILVGYNLRFHELLLHAKKIINSEKILTFCAYVGQYLPSWRKGVDYKDSYSAKKEMGGGVLRDLSHELDYSLWFCGPCEELTAMGGQFSELEITSDDIYSIIMRCKECPVVNIHLNYLDRVVRREIVINTETQTIFIDLVKGNLLVNGELKLHVDEGGAKTYLHQHQALLKGDYEAFCSYIEGLNVLRLIETIETSSITKQWMSV